MTRRRRRNPEGQDASVMVQAVPAASVEAVPAQAMEAAPETAVAQTTEKKKQHIFKFKKLHERGFHDDIRYRGPISYQGFQVLGWACIVIGVVVTMMSLGMKANAEIKTRLFKLADFLAYLPSMSLPFMLIANFSRILNNEEGYLNQMLRNLLATAGLFVGFNAFFYYYVVGALSQICLEPNMVMILIMDVMHIVTQYGFVSFNIFVDLLLCTMFMFFLNYRPKKYFQGKWIILFRLMGLLPVAYEVASIALKVECARGVIELPVWSFPLLTVKPPITFFVFVLMVLFLKFREIRYCRHGKTYEDYREFMQTNRNSLHFSIFMTVLLVVAAIVDLIIMISLMVIQAGSMEALEKMMELSDYYPAAIAIGFGKSIPLMFVAPIMLLFSYTRKPKNENISTLIPVVAIGLIVLIVIQGSYQVLCVANIPRINYREIRETLFYLIQFYLMGIGATT